MPVFYFLQLNWHFFHLRSTIKKKKIPTMPGLELLKLVSVSLSNKVIVILVQSLVVKNRITITWQESAGSDLSEK